ncbi:MAG: TonB-dependent receptor [Pseudogulbenkiania sp.]|nr:TonB-dependent receptor [Pseudogulbenkiania sp.]
MNGLFDRATPGACWPKSGPYGPVLVIAVLCLALHASGVAAGELSSAELAQLSIEELADIEITSVSRRPEALRDAAAAVYVITNEDIRRSGVTSLPEALRLAPNLEVARSSSSSYAITARGFNVGNANKLLVLIDGRSVYSPLNSGVFWDVQDVMLEDIERIEVISGPGGTLWGSNAVNGVINILTRSAKDTQGTLVSLGVGNEESTAAVRYGARLGEGGNLRLYAKGFRRDDTTTAAGTTKSDTWDGRQAGFRADWGAADNGFTLQGDAYDREYEQATSNDDKTRSGANLLGRWNRALEDGASVQVQAYYDRVRQSVPGFLPGFSEASDTYDIHAQHRFLVGGRHDIVWGGGYRQWRNDVTNGAVITFLPQHFELKLADLFVQDTIALSERLKLTLGAKLEHNSYTGLEVQPNARLAWKVDDTSLLWAALSRAVRTPSRVDRDFYVFNFPALPLRGGPDFQSEKLIAYELGYRTQPTPQTSLSVSTFYNVYDDLRTLEPVPGGTVVIANQMEGHTYGVETWGSYQVREGWRLSAGYTYLEKRLRLKPGSGDTASVKGADTDPHHQLSLRSVLDLPHGLEFDLMLRAIDDVPAQNVPRYTALDARLGWHVNKDLELSLTGNNLTDRRHPESGSTATRSELARSVFLKLLWSFR